MASTRFPKLVAFDLDYTLWDLWIDTHVTDQGPLRRHGDRLNEVLDRYNQRISFYQDVPDILHQIRAFKLDHADERSVIIAACSRTEAPDMAHRCLHLLLVPTPRKVATDASGDLLETGSGGNDDNAGSENETFNSAIARDSSVSDSNPVAAISFFDELEIYPGSKITHFKMLHKKTGIAYSEMLFFDDEHRNKEVERLGVTFCHVPRGLTKSVFERGLEDWRRKSGAST